ncbi:MAG: nucleoside triphosphate pyrophosphohydrolase [Candidatus Muirbacterium halophilum]|nr:nucleoside triphosphate pyrophosphohydrolase [Candidatus Muirbacterium halophilum]
MKNIVYNKLIRDNIPQIIKKSGKECDIEILTDNEYIKELDKKLEEEYIEYKESKNIEELADIVEVIYAIIESRKITLKEFEKIRNEKNSKRGKFKQKLYLKKVTTNT